MPKRATPANEFNRPTMNIGPNIYASSPSDALQCYLDIQESAQRIRASVKHGTVSLAEHAADTLYDYSDEDAWQDFSTLLKRAPVFFWPDNTATLVTEASRSYPLAEEEAVSLHAVRDRLAGGENVPPPGYIPRQIGDLPPCGLFVFESPQLHISFESGNRYPLQALLWSVGLHKSSGEVWLVIKGIAWHAGGLAGVVWLSSGGSAEAADFTVDSSFREERLLLTKWICSACMFLDQEILVTHAIRGNRQTSKRAAKAAAPTECHVIQLRKELHQESASIGSDAGDVEWSCRWLVRGHWRRQFFPSRGNHAPVWIHPHIKGPEDKPLKEERRTVYSVNR